MSGVLPTQGHQAAPNRTAAPADRIPMVVRDPSPALRAAAGSTLAATVTGVDAQGHLLLRTERGVLALQTQLRPPIGSEVTIQLRGGTGAQLQAYILRVQEPAGAVAPPQTTAPAGSTGHAAIPAPGPLTDAAALTRLWPDLDAAMRLLALAGGPVPVASPGSAFLAGLSAFLGALMGGDLRQWMGPDALRRLRESGHDGLLQRLERDFGHLQGLARDAGHDFRLFVLPFQHDGAARPLRLFVRKVGGPDGGESSEDAGQPHRFLVEVTFPRLGDIQIDGLAGPHRLELILRSRQDLGETLRHALTAIFNEMRQRAGFTGEMHFSTGRGWRFQPIEARDGGNGSVIV